MVETGSNTMYMYLYVSLEVMQLNFPGYIAYRILSKISDNKKFLESFFGLPKYRSYALLSMKDRTHDTQQVNVL